MSQPEESPVFRAVRSGSAEELERLLHDGADVDGLGTVPFSRPGLSTGLNHAAYYGSVTMVRMLLAHRADVNWRGGGRTSLHWAAQSGRGDEIVGALLDAGADPYLCSEATEFDGYDNPLDEGTPLLVAAARGHYAGVEALLARGVDPDRGGGGRTPLAAALARPAKHGPNVEKICRALLSAGAAVGPAEIILVKDRHPALLPLFSEALLGLRAAG